jgi:hypothetical protein
MYVKKICPSIRSRDFHAYLDGDQNACQQEKLKLFEQVMLTIHLIPPQTRHYHFDPNRTCQKFYPSDADSYQ